MTMEIGEANLLRAVVLSQHLIDDLLMPRFRDTMEGTKTSHEIVVSCQIIRIDRQHRLERPYGLFKMAREIVAHALIKPEIPIPGIVAHERSQFGQRPIILTYPPVRSGQECQGPRIVRRKPTRSLELCPGREQVAFR